MGIVNYKKCHECGSEMYPRKISRTFSFHNNEIEITGIEAYQCAECGECVYSDTEAERIERLIRSLTK